MTSTVTTKPNIDSVEYDFQLKTLLNFHIYIYIYLFPLTSEIRRAGEAKRSLFLDFIHHVELLMGS